MSGFFFVIIASLFASLSSIITAKTIRFQKGSTGYFTFYFLISFLAACCINSFSFSNFSFSLPLTLVGSFTGFLLISSMLIVGKGVQQGPSGLTFAFLNAGAVAPPIILAFIFSAPFGFVLNFKHIIGMALVVTGLFWAAKGTKLAVSSKKWFLYVLIAFAIQALILTIFQWRALLMQEDTPTHWCIPFHCSACEDFCFMPSMFFIAFLAQASLFFLIEKRAPHKREIIGGLFGGAMNGFSTFFLLLATSYATDLEKPMLFPFFAALVILTCNCLERFLHQEKINWFALSLLAAGIFIGTFF